MLSYYRAVRKASKQIAQAVNHTVEAIRDGRVEQEPAMTDRLLGSIEESLQGFTTNGIRWTAKTLTDRGRGAQETEFGADFLGALNIQLPDFKVNKGFLAQAKKAKVFKKAEMATLRSQCEKMLKFSPDSFVFFYGPSEMYVVPAISIAGSETSPDQHYNRSVQRFFEEHLECFIGDGSIRSATPGTLASLREQANARSALLISAEDEWASLPDEWDS